MASIPGVFSVLWWRHQTVDPHVRQPQVSQTRYSCNTHGLCCTCNGLNLWPRSTRPTDRLRRCYVKLGCMSELMDGQLAVGNKSRS